MIKKGIVELNRLHYANKIVEFVKQTNRSPLIDSVKVDVCDVERLLGSKLRSLRSAYKENTLSTSIVDIFKTNGMDMTILTRDHEYNGIRNILSIYNFKLAHGKYPALRSLDISERKLAIVHNNMKLANRGKHSNTMRMYDIYYKIISAYDMNDFFDRGLGGSISPRKTWIRSSNDTERNDMDIIRDVCKFISKYDKKPNKTSVNIYESRLAYRFRRLYRKHRDVGVPKKYIEYAIKLGYRLF